MDYNNKIKLIPKDKENNKKKSKEKYNTNYNTTYLSNNKDKYKKNKSITSNTNKRHKKKDYFENFIKDMNNNNINIINNNKKPIIQNTDIQFNDYTYICTQLIDKENDSYEDIKLKNKKLREIIIQVSKQLDILSNKYENIKNIAETEKKMLLEKLEKISTNYKLYAESYKENAKLKKEKDILAENISQLNILFNSCKNFLINLLKKNIQYYTKLKLFFENKNSQYRSINIDEFIFSLKEEMLNNLMQYKNHLDIINYPTFYNEYNSFINNECNYYGLNRQQNHFKEKSFIRINDMEQDKENNSFDQYRKYKKEKDRDRDISPKYEKRSIKKNISYREKTPCKNKSDVVNYKNIKNYNRTHFHEKYSNNKNNNTNINNNKPNISKERNNLFGDVGNVVNCKKRYSSRK